MKNTKLILAAATSLTLGMAHAKDPQWIEASGLKSNNLIHKVESPVVNSSKERVSFSYKIDAGTALDFIPQPFSQTSRQYWMDSSSDDLSKGLDLPVTGGVVIIRISPLTNNKSLNLLADSIELQNNGSQLKMNVFADSKALKATGAPFSDQSIALKVESVQGKLSLKVNNVPANTPFVIHVFEPESAVALNLNASKQTFMSNDDVEILANLNQFDKSVKAEINGYINRPDGSVLGELKFELNSKGQYSAKLPLSQPTGLSQGLWEAHVFSKGVVNGSEVLRDAQTSFAVNLNSASFDGELKLASNALNVGVNVGTEGRYEVRGVLMGTNNSGELQPLAVTMTANWLEKGTQSIKLDLDSKLIAESGLTAPFQLKNVQLTNQSYLAPVQSVVSGIYIPQLLTLSQAGLDIKDKK